MSHDAIETSEYEGSPIELFLFQRGTAAFWGYTSSTETLNIEGQIYRAVSMSRSNFESSQDYKRNNIKITMPITADFVQQYIIYPPVDIITISILQYHENDPDEELLAIWGGRVVNLTFREKNVEILCESIESVFNRNTLRRPYMRGCPYQLYDPYTCKVDPEAYKVTATLTNIDGITLTADRFLDDGAGNQWEAKYFAGGYLIFTVGSILNKRFIAAHSGNSIIINLPLPELIIGSIVDVYPGCPRNNIYCADRFHNILNYGGQPFTPLKNPMNGTPIY